MNTSNSAQPSGLQVWIRAMRPRTLPLAAAGIGMGAFIAAARGVFDVAVTLLCLLTALLLQILSNLANDYGDSVHGADSAMRAGPARAVQSGLIRPQTMRIAIGIAALLAMISGALLVWLSLGAQALGLALLFILLGAAAVWAAINYTAGGAPYGYAGLGDLFVFVFFGLVSVAGSYFLQARTLDWTLLLPGISIGAFAVAVLNINNIRDIESDRQAGKRSLPVRIGLDAARRYHWTLLLAGFAAALLYVMLNWRSPWQLLFVLVLPLLLRNGRRVATTPPSQLNPLLGQMSLITLLFVLAFGVGLLL